ncbi:MAG: RNA polymerase sigma factor, partial [Thermodesulfobacteriota bacterium]
MHDSYTSIKENELLTKIAIKDKAAFNELYNRFSQVVYNLSFRVVKNKSDAEEVVQEVFVQIWRKAENYDNQRGAVATWIMNITRSRAIDKIRSLKKMQGTISIEDTFLQFVSPKGFIKEDAKERREILSNALASIPLDQKIVLETIYFEGFTHTEASEELNIPVG